jgi:hypothetical protein
LSGRAHKYIHHLILLRATLAVVRWLIAVSAEPHRFASTIPSKPQILSVDHFPNSMPQVAAHF